MFRSVYGQRPLIIVSCCFREFAEALSVWFIALILGNAEGLFLYSSPSFMRAWMQRGSAIVFKLLKLTSGQPLALLVFGDTESNERSISVLKTRQWELVLSSNLIC